MGKRIIIEEDDDTQEEEYVPTRGESFTMGMHSGFKTLGGTIFMLICILIGFFILILWYG